MSNNAGLGGFLLVGNTGKQATISQATIPRDRDDNIAGYSSIYYSRELKGEPRLENLFLVRMLGRTTYIEMLKDIVKNQIAATDFNVQPIDEVEEPDNRLLQLAEEATDFFDGNFNSDGMSWDELIKVLLDDILDFDSGILELVPDNQGIVEQLIPRDGATFTVNRKENGLLPAPGTAEPAYYQFSKQGLGYFISQQHGHGIDVNELMNEYKLMPNMQSKVTEVPFTRDQIVWFSESPRSYSSYGQGRTQKVKRVAEIVLNGDIHRNRFFLENEFHKGFITVAEDVPQDKVKDLNNIFQSTKGNEYQIPIIGGAQADWVSIDPTPDKMQFLESHKWYITSIIMSYGLNDAEAGLHENANLSVSNEMKFNVWRRTTRPILSMIESKINREILPYMRQFHESNGLIKFKFDRENDFLTQMQQEIDKTDLDMGIATYNELRRRRGEKPFGDIGDLPKFVLEPLAQQNPGYVASYINPELTDVPEPMAPTLSLTTDRDNNNNNGLRTYSYKKDNKEQLEQPEQSEHTEDTKLEFPNSYRELLNNAAYYKESLRNERGKYPNLKGIMDNMQKDLEPFFEDVKKRVEDNAKTMFPEKEQDKPIIADTNWIDDIEMDGLSDTIHEYSIQGLEKGVDYHKNKLEKKIDERLTLPTEVKASLGNIDITRTFTYMLLSDRALKNATEITGTVRDSIKILLLNGLKEGASIDTISERIKDRFKDITKNHSELIARTEILSSARHGSQALAESTDIVGGKEWIATNDSRTRPWHAAMDGVIVPKDKQFVVPSGWQGAPHYQPKNYPKSVKVAGDDQPFNCRCDMSPVLKEEMPNTRDLPSYGIELKGLSIRQIEVWQEHNNGEKSFAEFWKNIRENKSVREVTRDFGMSNSTVKEWDKQVLHPK